MGRISRWKIAKRIRCFTAGCICQTVRSKRYIYDESPRAGCSSSSAYQTRDYQMEAHFWLLCRMTRASTRQSTSTRQTQRYWAFVDSTTSAMTHAMLPRINMRYKAKSCPLILGIRCRGILQSAEQIRRHQHRTTLHHFTFAYRLSLHDGSNSQPAYGQFVFHICCQSRTESGIVLAI